MKHKPIWVWAGIMRERRIEKTESMKEGKIERSKVERERQMEKQRDQISRFLSGTPGFEIKPETDYLHAGFT